MKYYIAEDERTYTDIDDVIEYCIHPDYHEDDDDFEEWVNDNYNGTEINGEYYSAYTILDSIDNYNLREILRIYCDEQNENDEDNARAELRCANIDDVIYIQSYTVYVMADDKDEETETIDGLRDRLTLTAETLSKEKSDEKKTEDDLMKMFQVVGD
jgi:hypothetical protein